MFSSLLLLFTLCMTVIWIVMLLIPMSLGWALLLSFLLFLVASRVRVLFLYRMRDRLQRFIECDALLSKQRIEAFRTQPSMTSSKLHELSHSERQAQLRRTLDKSDELNRFFIGHLLFNIQDQLFRHSLLWELQDWERADQVLKEFWYIRATIPALVAYMIVRGYMRGIVWDDLEFTNVMWHKACKASPLPYAAQSWILVQKKDFGRALTLLSEACKTVKNET